MTAGLLAAEDQCLSHDDRACCATEECQPCTCQAIYLVEMRPSCRCGAVQQAYLVCIRHEEVARTQRWECSACYAPAPYIRTVPLSQGASPVALGAVHA